ncbi:PEP-CTERM sorting domain-containing protein [Anabaena sp. CCY 9402-a]|uniref:PEP-CTERM sorting domain-containing protein n=1 Tax=Anabaena sp. CCY 9402-a TaxID=3103867 RepID=UPI0039C5AB43
MKFSNIIPAIFTSSCLLFFGIPSAYGIGLITVDKQVFDDQPEGFILNLEGTINEQIPVGRNSISLDFLNNGFWITNIEIDYNPSSIPLDPNPSSISSDRLTIRSISRHIMPLHPEDGGVGTASDEAISVSFPFSELDNSFINENTGSFTDKRPHGQHSDVYFGSLFIQGENGDIKNWKYSLIGSHRQVPVPEPSSIGLILAGIFGLMFNKMSKNSKIS